jgi:hypothetical protein
VDDIVTRVQLRCGCWSQLGPARDGSGQSGSRFGAYFGFRGS